MEKEKQRRLPRSIAWKFFTPNADYTDAKCNLCKHKDVVLKTPERSTSSLLRHLGSVHPRVFTGRTVDPKETAETQNSTEIVDDSWPERIEETVSKLAAVDGLSFKTIAKSKVIKDMAERLGITDWPNSGSTVREMVLRFYAEKKEEMKLAIKEVTKSGKKFAVSLDEWTSIANKRYVNIFLHSEESKKWNLGLSRILGSFTAEACLDQVKLKLEEFGVTMFDVSCFVTDGAANMKKFGEISGRNNLLCMTHGFHLAVTDVMYKKDPQVESAHSIQIEIDSIKKTPEQKHEESENEDDELESSLSVIQDEYLELKPSLRQLVAKTRKVVRIFRESAVKMEELQKKIIGEKDRELPRDMKTRWNSLLNMLEHVLELRCEIQMALIELKEPDSSIFTDSEICLMEEIVSCLQPVRAATEAICQEDANLISCDVSIGFMLSHLASNGNSLSKELLNVLKRRINERRSVLYDVMQYLHFGNTDSEALTFPAFAFEKISKKDLTAAIKDLATKYLLSPEGDSATQQPSQENSNTDLNVPCGPPCKVLKQELSMAIKKALSKPTSSRKSLSSDKLLMRTIKNEMALFESGGNRGKILESLYSILFVIPPSSIECERAFSTANYMCSKIRSRLGDNSLNALVFLKHYLK